MMMKVITVTMIDITVMKIITIIVIINSKLEKKQTQSTLFINECQSTINIEGNSINNYDL